VTLDPTALAWLVLGALLMLLVVQSVVLLAAWSLIGSHVTRVVTEAGKRAVTGRLGNGKKST
jgi:hypothetical protein